MATTRRELQDSEIGDLWRRYKQVEGQDASTDLIVALLRKLVIQGARNIPYGNWVKGLLTRCAGTEYPKASGIQMGKQVPAGLNFKHIRDTHNSFSKILHTLGTRDALLGCFSTLALRLR